MLVHAARRCRADIFDSIDSFSGDNGLRMADFFYRNVGPDEDIVSVVLAGELDMTGSEYLLQCVEHQIENGCTKMILDCDQLHFVSSLGLGMVMRAHSKMRKIGGDVKLAAVHGAIAKLISLVHLDRVFEIYPSVDDAIAAFAKDDVKDG